MFGILLILVASAIVAPMRKQNRILEEQNAQLLTEIEEAVGRLPRLAHTEKIKSEITVGKLPECGCTSYQTGAEDGTEMCQFGEHNCALRSNFGDDGCSSNAIHCVLSIADAALAKENQALLQQNAKLMEKIEAAVGEKRVGNECYNSCRMTGSYDECNRECYGTDAALAKEHQALLQQNAKLMEKIEAAVGDAALATENQALLQQNAKLMEKIEAAVSDAALPKDNQALIQQNAKLMEKIEAAVGESKVGGSDCNSPPKSKCELCEGYMACDGKEYVITSYQLVDDAKPHPLFGCTYPKTYTYVDLCPEDGAASSEVAVSQVNAPSKTLDKPKKTVNYGPEYAGCFEYVKSDTLLIGEDTPLNCLKKCSDGGSAYFGLVSNTCFCVKEKIDESTIKSSDGCTTSADGLPIGGGNAISVYTTAQTYDSITCDELCASGEAGSLCTCDTQPPAKSATTGPEALSILEQNESVIKVFAFIGCVSLVYYGLKCSCMKAKQYYEEVEGHEEI